VKLCLQCAHVGKHAPGCAAETDALASATDAKSKNDRVLAAMEEVKRLLADGENRVAAAPREALELAWSAQVVLDQYPASDLTAFDTKRAANDLAKSVKQLREKAVAGMADGEATQYLDDLTYARKALELLADVIRRRREAATFDLNALGKLPRARVNYAREEAHGLEGVCLEIEARLAESVGVEKEVESWGNANLSALAKGENPALIPTAKNPKPGAMIGALAGGGVLVAAGIGLDAAALLPKPAGLAVAGAGFVGLIAGLFLALGRNKARAQLPVQFREAGVRYRERIFLSGSLRLLRMRTSRLQVAEEAFRKFTSGEGAPGWKRLRTEAKDALKFLVEWDGKRAIEDTLTRGVTEALGRRGKLRNYDDVKAEEWDVLAKALALDFTAGDEAQRFDALTPLLAENEVLPEVLAAAKREVQETWNQGAERRPTRRMSSSNVSG
jgi:hypothetical protein